MGVVQHHRRLGSMSCFQALDKGCQLLSTGLGARQLWKGRQALAERDALVGKRASLTSTGLSLGADLNLVLNLT